MEVIMWSKRVSGFILNLDLKTSRDVFELIELFHDNKAYLVHGFIKKTWKIPLNDMRYARQVQKEIDSIA